MTLSFSRVWAPLTAIGLILTACGGRERPAGASLTVAAAANLAGVMDEIAKAFEQETKVHVVLSYGSTAQLALQIEHGGPFDVFAAADTEHVDALISKGKLRPDSRAIYARGQLALWVPSPTVGVQQIEDLKKPAVRFIAIAQPDLAPYGRASIQALKSAGIWESVQSKVAYANSISAAKQYASSGNATAAFTALSLLRKEGGTVVKVDPGLYRPLDQALAITTSTRQDEAARRFAAFVLGEAGRAMLAENGYLLP